MTICIAINFFNFFNFISNGTFLQSKTVKIQRKGTKTKQNKFISTYDVYKNTWVKTTDLIT